MNLTVASKEIPLGLLAIINSNEDIKKNISISSGKETSLKVDNTTELKSTANIARYLTRAYNLLDEQKDANQRLAHIFDLAITENAGALASVVEAKKTAFLSGEQLSVVDYIAWFVLKQNNLAANYVKSVESSAAVQEAIKAASELPSSSSAAVDSIPTVPGVGSDPSTNPLDAFRNLIAVQIASLGNLEPGFVYQAIDLPRSLENGDLAIALPRLRLKGNPAAIAKEWAETFVTNDYITEVSSTGPFLNFRINKTILIKSTLNMVSQFEHHYGDNKSGDGKTVVVEFSSPNIAKPFHAGHLRSTIIGAFINNVYKANGWKTITMNYLGDWGKQYGKWERIVWEKGEFLINFFVFGQVFWLSDSLNMVLKRHFLKIPLSTCMTYMFKSTVMPKLSPPSTMTLVLTSSVWKMVIRKPLHCGNDSVNYPLSSTVISMAVLTSTLIFTLVNLKWVLACREPCKCFMTATWFKSLRVL